MNGETIVSSSPSTQPELLFEPSMGKMNDSIEVRAESEVKSTDFLKSNQVTKMRSRTFSILARGRKLKDKSRDSSSQHIKFRDMIQGQKIAEVQFVESYKEFNVLSDDPKDCASCILL